jgi:hypothetical protein
MDERDEKILILQRMVEYLERELAKARVLQFKLFKYVPPEKLFEIIRETPETKQWPRSNTCASWRGFN